MPSRARSPRLWLELGARTAALALIAWSLWLATRPFIESPERTHVPSADLSERLPAWARGGAPDSLHVALDSLPDDTTRAWLVALRRTGASVSWSGELAPVALAIEPVNAPAGGAQLLVAAPDDAPIALRDAVGPFDTVRSVAAGAAIRVPTLAEPAEATVSGTVARARAIDSLAPGGVLVLGTAGWEARYVIAALEESGWSVDARLTIGPALVVRRGSPVPIDTARYAAVIALDSAASGDTRRLAAYARSGGGIILSGVAAALGALRDVAPGRPGVRIRPAVLSFTAGEPRRALGFVSMSGVREDALVLEARDGRPVVAARRAALGRVLQIGYDETWRWRMQGGDAGPESHRRWWSAAVAATARRTAAVRESSGSVAGAGAPRAAISAALGPASAAPDLDSRSAPRHGPDPWLLIAGSLLLLAEWTSRRLRGAA
jgi:hypothetical protein